VSYAPVLTAAQIERIRLLAKAREVTVGEVLFDPNDDTLLPDQSVSALARPQSQPASPLVFLLNNQKFLAIQQLFRRKPMYFQYLALGNQIASCSASAISNT
jgi:hypothetical protein